MGVGKTTVGALLAESLGVEFVDTDAVIESSRGEKVSEIFARHGEPVFRGLEQKVVQDLVSDPDPRVIGLGGGAILDPIIRELVLKSGFVVWLRANPETILERVLGEPGRRPLLEGAQSRDEMLGRIRSLLSARQQAYGEAQLRVLTDGKTPRDVASEVISLLS
jgi:shikimate kinase